MCLICANETEFYNKYCHGYAIDLSTQIIFKLEVRLTKCISIVSFKMPSIRTRNVIEAVFANRMCFDLSRSTVQCLFLCGFQVALAVQMI
jgi:hypothetical protein